MASYEKSRVELDRSIGLLLEHSGIDIGDAQRGQVNALPDVPYVTVRQETRPRVTQNPATPTADAAA